MNKAVRIDKKLFDIYFLFTRNPFIRCFTYEIEFYSNADGGLLGLISLDRIDNDYSSLIFARDETKQYTAERMKHSIPTIHDARKWIDEQMSSQLINCHGVQNNDFFNLFQNLQNDGKQHPGYVSLNNFVGLSSAKEVIKEVSYHYKDIDGNFIEQFQSLNGFDSRVWELFLFCFFREQEFSFQRSFNAPDYMIYKSNCQIAVEAVIVSRKTDIGDISIKSEDEIKDSLNDIIPLLFGNALFEKMKKRYWEKKHVKGKPFIIAIADFHDNFSMLWAYSAIIEYLYGYKYNHSFDEMGNLVVEPIKVKDYVKKNGTKIPSGFFFSKDAENVSAVIFSSVGTVTKFNRMGKQAGLGCDKVTMLRTSAFYDHSHNSVQPNFITYIVDKTSNETWSEGVVIFHNPNAKHQLDSIVFDDNVAQCFFENGNINSKIPKYYPFCSFTKTIIRK